MRLLLHTQLLLWTADEQERLSAQARCLLGQSIVEGITLLTSDPRVAQYPVPVRKV